MCSVYPEPCCPSVWCMFVLADIHCSLLLLLVALSSIDQVSFQRPRVLEPGAFHLAERFHGYSIQGNIRWNVLLGKTCIRRVSNIMGRRTDRQHGRGSDCRIRSMRQSTRVPSYRSQKKGSFGGGQMSSRQEIGKEIRSCIARKDRKIVEQA